MKTSRMTAYTFAALAVLSALLAMSGIATAQIDTSWGMTAADSIRWTISNRAIDGKLVPGEIQTTNWYSENTMASGGRSVYTKATSLDTGNAIPGQFNIDARKIFSFDGIVNGTETGRAISSETIGFDSAGKPLNASAFHNTVAAGSSMDIARGSVATEAQARTVAAANVPVELNYGINLRGMPGDPSISLPAVGSAGAFMEGHLEQGKINSTHKQSDLVFSHSTGASGLIGTFSESMHYSPGMQSIFW